MKVSSKLASQNFCSDNKVTKDEFYSCLESRARSKEADLRRRGACRFPAFRSVLDFSFPPGGYRSFPFCPNATAYYQGLMLVFEVLQGYFATEGCLVPERQDYFGTRERRQVGRKNMLF